MSIKQRIILMKYFIDSQVGYCPFTWMFRGRGVNNKINHSHERSFRIIYKDTYEIKKTTNQSMSYLVIQKFLKNSCKNK